MRCVIIKLGGSLLDVPALGERLRTYLAAMKPAQALVVVGGGRAADEVRRRDCEGRLSAEQAHWAAVRAMSDNAHNVAALLGAPIVATLSIPPLSEADNVAVLDASALLRAAEERGTPPLPRTWDVTADTIAAQLALLVGATELVLLKSRSVARDCPMEQAVAEGIIDAYLPTIARRLLVSLVNFRREPPAVCCRWDGLRGRAAPTGAPG